MRLIKWYLLALATAGLILAALTFLKAYNNASQFADGAVSYYQILIDICDLIAHASIWLIGSAFIVGLVSIVYESMESSFALTPAVLVLMVSAVVAIASAVSWYGWTSTTEVYGAGQFVVQDVALNLSIGIGLALLLGLVASYQTGST